MLITALLSVALAAAVVALGASVAHRWTRRAARMDAASTAVSPADPERDLEDLLSGAAARASRRRDPRGSLAADTGGPEPATPASAPVNPARAPAGGAPVWVRRLDQTIVVMPTHRDLPVEAGGPTGRDARSGR